MLHRKELPVPLFLLLPSKSDWFLSPFYLGSKAEWDRKSVLVEEDEVRKHGTSEFRRWNTEI